jgi:hypothetical protein
MFRVPALVWPLRNVMLWSTENGEDGVWGINMMGGNPSARFLLLCCSLPPPGQSLHFATRRLVQRIDRWWRVMKWHRPTPRPSAKARAQAHAHVPSPHNRPRPKPKAKPETGVQAQAQADISVQADGPKLVDRNLLTENSVHRCGPKLRSTNVDRNGAASGVASVHTSVPTSVDTSVHPCGPKLVSRNWFTEISVHRCGPKLRSTNVDRNGDV